MKFETYRQYDPRRVALAESALLSVWTGLSSYHDDLVLIGGLVPKYLCGDLSSTRVLPRPVTLDADIGIALGASAGTYGSLHWDLQAQGFSREKNAGSRYTKTVGDFIVPVDFVTEQKGVVRGTVMVDDIVADVLPGIARALQTARSIEIEGIDLQGASQRTKIRVCEVGPFLVLKLRAFAKRQQPKDAFDILYTLRHYDGGSKSATHQFAQEKAANNSAFPDAVRCLEQHFVSEKSAAPVKASVFLHGPLEGSESEDQKVARLRLQQDVVNAAQLLLSAIA